MTHDNTLFAVGEVINPDAYGIHLRIEELLPNNRIRASICKAEYLSRNVAVHPFQLGEELFFRPGHPDNLWVIENNNNWFLLYVRADGTKRFEHYR